MACQGVQGVQATQRQVKGEGGCAYGVQTANAVEYIYSVAFDLMLRCLDQILRQLNQMLRPLNQMLRALIKCCGI